MKAIVLTQPGPVQNLVLEEVPIPTLQPDEVLIRVAAISINPVDVQTRSGRGVYNQIHHNSPLILGWDISGVVTESRSALFKAGDAVFGMLNFPQPGKAYAEYVAAPASQLAHKPATITHQEAAAATLAALTAWQALMTKGTIQAGERVLIPAASGGTGHYAVQIAKQVGAYVIATASAANRDFVLSLGADECIDYQNQSLPEATKDIDFVFDSLGHQNIDDSLAVMKQGGRLITLKGQPDEAQRQTAAAKRIQLSAHLVEPSGHDMASLAALLGEGRLKSHLSKTFRFEQIGEAHAQLETGHTVGKLVVDVSLA